MATPVDLLAQAQRLAGLPYRLGSEAALHSDDIPKAVDCSELVEWACARVGVFIPDGTVNQFPWCRDHGSLIGVDEAISTPGALLFTYLGSNRGGGMGNHVAISRGDGTTIEARSTLYGVGNFDAHGRPWTHGALIPGIDYTPAVEVLALEVSQPAISEDDMKGFQIIADDGTAWAFFPGGVVINLGGKPELHVGLNSTGTAPVVMTGMPATEVNDFAAQWQASV